MAMKPVTLSDRDAPLDVESMSYEDIVALGKGGKSVEIDEDSRDEYDPDEEVDQDDDEDQGTDVEDSGDEDEDEIEIIDDTPSADRGKPVGPDDDDEDVTPEELKQIQSKAVKERIDKVTKQKHNWRRKAEALEREKQAALEYARSMYNQFGGMAKRTQEAEAAYLETTKKAAKLSVEQAEKNYRAALDIGDPAEITAAQIAMNRAMFEENAASKMQPRHIDKVQPPPAEKILPADVRNWMGRNPWFNQDADKTRYAVLISEKLLRQGVTSGSKEYYSAIDRAVAQYDANFASGTPSGQEEASKPDKVRPRRSERQSATPVQPGSSSVKKTANGKTVVSLTASQMAMAKSLGVPIKEYAKQIANQSRS